MTRLLAIGLLCVASQTTTAPTLGPVIYLAQTPNYCADLSGSTYYLYVYSPDDADFSGVSLDLEIDGTVSGPPLVAADATNGISLDALDTSSLPYHIELSWTPRTLEHEKVAYLTFPTPPVWGQGATTTNVVFTRPGGANVSAGDFTTFPGYPECILCMVCFNVDAHILVAAGETTTIPFEWVYSCGGSGGWSISATDSEGWVSGWQPTAGTANANCGACFIQLLPGTVDVTVPAGVPVGTTSSLLLEGMPNGAYCPGMATLEVVTSLPTENTTWGGVKALYR